MILSIKTICEHALFGDLRLTTRFGKILKTLSIQIKHSIPLTFKEWPDIKGAYRFLNNKKVTDRAILESQTSALKVEAFSTYLALHDTTHDGEKVRRAEFVDRVRRADAGELRAARGERRLDRDR